jgi:hypothetical protein
LENLYEDITGDIISGEKSQYNSPHPKKSDGNSPHQPEKIFDFSKVMQ